MIDEQRYGTIFFLREHSKPRTSSTVVRVPVVRVSVRYARWLACQDSLSCLTGLALANEKKDEGSKGVDLLNVGGQTGKDCLLTRAHGVKFADRRHRTRNNNRSESASLTTAPWDCTRLTY